MRAAFCLKMAVLLAFTAMVTSSCSRNTNQFESPSTAADDIGEAPFGLRLSPFYLSQQVTQTQGAVRNSVDLVVTYDNSGSMGTWNSEIQKDFSTLISDLEAQSIDFRIGVLDANEVDAAIDHSSRFVGPNMVIKSTDTNPSAEVLSDFQALQSGYIGGVDEEPLSVLVGSTRDLANSSFFRPTASTYFIAMGDAEGHDVGVGDVPAAGQTLTDFKSGVSWGFSALGAPSANLCSGTEDSSQPAYEALASASGGVMGRICDSSYVDFFHAVAANVLSILTEVVLQPGASGIDFSQIDPASVSVAVDGIDVANSATLGFQFHALKKSISFPGSYRPTPGQSIVVSFEEKYD